MATACLNLCFYSLAPSQLDFLDPQSSETGKTEAIPLGSPHKSWCIRHMDQLFLFPGKSCELEFLLCLLCAELWGGNIATTSPGTVSILPTW